MTAVNSYNNPRGLSATSKSRKINSSKPTTNKMNINYNDSVKGTEENQNDNNDLFDEPNFEEN